MRTRYDDRKLREISYIEESIDQRFGSINMMLVIILLILVILGLFFIYMVVSVKLTW